MRLLTIAICVLVLASNAAGILENLHVLKPLNPRLRNNLCPPYPLPSASASDVLSKLQPFLTEATANISAALKADNSPGGAVVNLVYNDTVIWTKGFGLINDSEPSRGAPDGDSAFRIGSITKVFTALMMLMFRDNGALPSLDQDVTKYLPELKIQNPFQTKRGITFRQLSSHMAGLPVETPCPDIFTTGCNLTYDKIYENLAKLQLMSPPGSVPSYSNLGFAILGRTLEKIKGPDWETVLQKTILEPLGMKHSGNNFTADVMKYLAVGYAPDGTVANLINIGYEAPAGQMFSSTNDLAQLMRMLFKSDKSYNPDKGQILDGETIREWMEPAYKYYDRTGYGHPWELIPVGNYTLRTKLGEIPGYATQFAIAHEIKTGFVFLQSCDACTSFHKILEIGQRLILEVSRILWTMQPGPSLPPNPSEYVGVYSGQVTQTIEATVNITLGEVLGHKALIVSTGYSEFTDAFIGLAQWLQGDTFQLTTEGLTVFCGILGGTVGEIVDFQRNGSEVVSLTVPGLIYGVVFRKMS